MLNNGNYFESLREKGSTKLHLTGGTKYKMLKGKKNNYANKVASEGREKGKRSKASDSDCYFLLAKKASHSFNFGKRI